MSLQAATFIDGRDRPRLERMCRYLLRPPFAHDAVQALPDGRVRIVFRRPTRSGATHVDLEPLRFLARMVGLVPPPRQHQVRYFGVFANHHHLRERVAPQLCAALATAPVQVMLFDPTGLRPWQPGTSVPKARAPARIGWASLLARVLAIDVSVCRGGPRVVPPATLTPAPDAEGEDANGDPPPVAGEPASGPTPPPAPRPPPR